MAYPRISIILGLFLFLATFVAPLKSAVGADTSSRAAIESQHEPQGAKYLSEVEFRKLAEDLAPKVNLFKEAWQKDPNAEFYGGTTRDFLYYIKGKFRGAKSRDEALGIAHDLRQTPIIDVREFIAQDSDIDVISNQALDLSAENYGVRKIDTLRGDLFDPATDAGKNELLQGYVPAEKIRLNSKGIVPATQFGDGVGEILSGRLTVHFTSPEEFARSHYAQKGLNHPILLALRYLRLVAQNYFQEHGKGYPDPQLLLDIDPASRAAVEKVIQGALNGRELAPFLRQESFSKWLNGSIQKAFRSYTNPTAALELMNAFHVDELVSAYGLEPINQYVFAKHRDPKAISKFLKDAGIDESKLYEPVSKHFKDGKFYHGTKTEDAFRSILLQGVLPSGGSASAGAGLYGVSMNDRDYAENWGGDRDRLVSFDVDPKARIVDITHGEGLRAWHELNNHRMTVEDFADAVGADLIRYPYSVRAYVVKNSAVLSKADGVYRQVMLLTKALDAASQVNSRQGLLRFASGLGLGSFNKTEASMVQNALSNSPLYQSATEADAIRLDTEALIAESKGGASNAGLFFLGRLKSHRVIPPEVYGQIAAAIPKVESRRAANELTEFIADVAFYELLPRISEMSAEERLKLARSERRDPINRLALMEAVFKAQRRDHKMTPKQLTEFIVINIAKSVQIQNSYYHVSGMDMEKIPKYIAQHRGYDLHSFDTLVSRSRAMWEAKVKKSGGLFIGPSDFPRGVAGDFYMKDFYKLLSRYVGRKDIVWSDLARALGTFELVLRARVAKQGLNPSWKSWVKIAKKQGLQMAAERAGKLPAGRFATTCAKLFGRL